MATWSIKIETERFKISIWTSTWTLADDYRWEWWLLNWEIAIIRVDDTIARLYRWYNNWVMRSISFLRLEEFDWTFYDWELFLFDYWDNTWTLIIHVLWQCYIRDIW